LSWATLVTGYVAFKKGTPEELKQKILEELKEALEADFEYNETDGEYHVEDLNWHSHVTEEKIEAIYQKWKPFFNVFSISLYYLNEADYDEYMEDDDDDDAGSILAKFIDEIVNDINMNKLYRPDSGYLVKLHALVEFLKFADIDKDLVARKIAELTEVLQEVDLKESRDTLLNLISVLEERSFSPAKLKKLVLLEVA